jgi:hypothetical protein
MCAKAVNAPKQRHVPACVIQPTPSLRQVRKGGDGSVRRLANATMQQTQQQGNCDPAKRMHQLPC